MHCEPPSPSPKRGQILRAAEDLFLEQGYGAVSMEAIARAAGVSKATLYAHFSGKNALFGCIVADKGQESPLDDSLFAADSPDLRPVLLAVGLRLMRFLQRHRTIALQRVVAAESPRFPELGRALYENGPVHFCKRFTPWLEAQIRLGRVRSGDPIVATQHYLALLRGDLFLRGVLGVRPAPDDAEITASVTAAVDAWLRAYGTGESASPSFF